MDFWEIFTLVTGLIYIVLEIRQSRWMWIVGVLTGVAAVVVFARQALWASTGLNAYYVAISFWGLYAWARDERKLDASAEAAADALHLRPITLRTLLLSAFLFVAGTAALVLLLRVLGDPMSALDAAVAVLSAIATWWLSRSHISQWWLWIAADLCSTLLCLSQGLYWMTALYAFYTISAGIGYAHWRRHGVYIQ